MQGGSIGVSLLHWGTRAHRVAVAEGIVDAGDGGPEFVAFGALEPGGGEGGLFARVGVGPIIGGGRRHGQCGGRF